MHAILICYVLTKTITKPITTSSIHILPITNIITEKTQYWQNTNAHCKVAQIWWAHGIKPWSCRFMDHMLGTKCITAIRNIRNLIKLFDHLWQFYHSHFQWNQTFWSNWEQYCGNDTQTLQQYYKFYLSHFFIVVISLYLLYYMKKIQSKFLLSNI